MASGDSSKTIGGLVSLLVVSALVVTALAFQVVPVASYCYIECYSTYSTTSLASTSTTTRGWTIPSPAKLPSEITAYVPIVLVNSELIPAKSGYDQFLVVNSSNYAPYEASGLQNVEFFNLKGAVLPSWLESGNSNTSAATAYWVKFTKPIPAGANATIFMGFAPRDVVLFAKKVGEAPQLSPTYGQYDSGLKVFNFYDNFATSSSNTKWAVNLTGGATFSRADSLHLTFGTSQGYFATGKKFGLGTAFDALVTSFGPQDAVGYIDTKPALPSPPTGEPDWAGAYVRSQCGLVFPDQVNSSAEANGCGAAHGFFVNSTSASGVFSVADQSPGSTLQTINYSAGATNQPLSIGAPAYPARTGFTGQGQSLDVQWARVRNLPPNDVMPSYTFGYPQVPVAIAKGAHISTNSNFFVPPVITVTVNSRVTWTNFDSVYHTVTSDASLFGSAPIAPKSTFSVEFTQPGTYYYHCAIHPWMHGTIVVVKP